MLVGKGAEKQIFIEGFCCCCFHCSSSSLKCQKIYLVAEDSVKETEHACVYICVCACKCMCVHVCGAGGVGRLDLNESEGGRKGESE